MKSLWNKYIEFIRNNRKKVIFYGLVVIVLVSASIYLSVSLSKLFTDSDKLTSTDPIDNSIKDDNILEDDYLEGDSDIDDIAVGENPDTDDEQGKDNNGLDIDNNVNDDRVTEDLEPSDIINPDEKVEDGGDPQTQNKSGVEMEITDMDTAKEENNIITYGIDVAKWQGVIDWKKVKEEGITYAMVRVGFRTLDTGIIAEDPYGEYNIQQALKNGIKVGIYFFSTATNKEEAKEEARWVADFIAPYSITYPVAYNCEGFTDPNNRQYGMTKEERTDLAITFLDYIGKKGYTPMFYASKNELEGDTQWITSTLSKKYKIWVAQYINTIEGNMKSSYSGDHHMWQYTSKGVVPGISGPVDLNIAYFDYQVDAKPKDDKDIEEVVADPTALINFKEVSETVTAKDVTNLRSFPSSKDPDTIVAVLKYKDTAERIGIGDNGWSKVRYNGEILYAVTSYLTTDLNYKDNISSEKQSPSVDNPEAGITFTEVNESVTAKEVTNLRLVPSTEIEDTVSEVLYNGDIAIRTGIGDNGWSRVEYKGKTLYGVTSYMIAVEED
ncbi:MAG TPA: glycoside hydrolase family 25 [Clostridiales bacterium]|nr:glycoside hydrolase family 25 [Clostridiales bacterium]